VAVLRSPQLREDQIVMVQAKLMNAFSEYVE
jgi:hypothetical protein